MLGLYVGSTAQADVITTHRMIETDKPVSRLPETLTLASDDAFWSETWGGDYGPQGASYQRTVQLIQYAKNRVVTMDVALRIYTVQPLGSEFAPGDEQPKFRLTRLEDEKVLGYDAHHFFVDMMFEKSPYANGGTLARQEIWVLPADSNSNLPTQIRNFRTMELSNVTGDTQFLPEIQSGILIRQAVFDSVAPDVAPSKVVYTQDISALSIGSLPAGTFEIPPGYRQLSPAEYRAELGRHFGEALDRKLEQQANAT